MMIAADPFKVAVDAATDQRMLEKYGDMNSTEAMNRAADEAVHNEARTKFVAMELNALAKLANASQPGATYRVTTQIAKNVAERIVNKRVKDLRPNQFKAAQQKLAKDAAAAFKKGNLLEAATLKRQQLVSMYALKAAEKANDFALKARTYLKKFDSPGVRKKVDPTQLSQIDAILDRYDVRKLSPKDVQRKETLAAWIKKQEDMGIEPAIDPDVADEMQRKHYSQLTVEELRGLIDSIRNRAHRTAQEEASDACRRARV